MRPYIYFGLFLIAFIGLISSLSLRGNLKAQLIRGSNVPYSVVKTQGTEKIVNHYKVKINYYQGDQPKVTLKTNNDIQIIIPDDPINLMSDNEEANIFFQFNKDLLVNGNKKVKVYLYNLKTKTVMKEMEVNLVGPN